MLEKAKRGFSHETSRRKHFCQHLDVSPKTLISDFRPPEMKELNFCCFKPVNLWLSLTAAIVDEYSEQGCSTLPTSLSQIVSIQHTLPSATSSLSTLAATVSPRQREAAVVQSPFTYQMHHFPCERAPPYNFQPKPGKSFTPTHKITNPTERMLARQEGHWNSSPSFPLIGYVTSETSQRCNCNSFPLSILGAQDSAWHKANGQ